MRQFVCPSCGAANRAPDGKDPRTAKCGRCKTALFSAHPTEVDAAAFRAHRAGTKGAAVLVEDVSVPRSALPAMFAAIERVQERHGILIPTVAHAGDGNLHPNFVFETDMVDGFVDVPGRVWDAADELFRECLRLGGTLTGEHGVGILKRRWLRDELGDDVLELQRGVKAVFDPLGIMNPGKAI